MAIKWNEIGTSLLFLGVMGYVCAYQPWKDMQNKVIPSPKMPEIKFPTFKNFGINDPLTQGKELTAGKGTSALLESFKNFGSPVTFGTDLTQALADARTAHKPLVMFIYQDGGENSKIQSATFTDLGMYVFSSQAVYVKLEAGTLDGAIYLNELQTHTLPVVAVFDATNPLRLPEIGRITTAMKPAEFIPAFRDLITRATRTVKSHYVTETVKSF